LVEFDPIVTFLVPQAGDETLSNIGETVVFAGRNFFLEDLRKEGRTLLVTSHHMEEVGMLVDRVIAMEDGKKVIECAPTEMAEALGLRAWLHIVTDDKASTLTALASLRGAGLEARENSNGVLVEVSAQSKGLAISTLYEAGVHIADLEVWR
jgi:ABC-type multidrug transport system ATPase subunit